MNNKISRISLFSPMACCAVAVFCICLGQDHLLAEFPTKSGSSSAGWKKHVIYTGVLNTTAVAGDVTGDGLPDVISNLGGPDSLRLGGKTILFIAPKWEQVLLDENPQHGFIHSELFDVDGDGDLDYIGARYSPGLIVWLEQPKQARSQQWPLRIVDDQVNGIHGLLKGDVDRDGKLDLLATSGQPKGQFPNSLVWYRIPKNPHTDSGWQRNVFAKGDAPGLSHYLGFGDINGDGRPDAASAAKGGPTAVVGIGNWFAWWDAPKDPTKVWTKHLIADRQLGATNIHPADVNGDGKVDFIATRGHGLGVIWFEAPKWKLHEIHPTLKGAHCLVVIDMDADGDWDAATCAYGDKLAVWFENDGKGNFTTHIVGRDQEAYDIRALDMDRDGDLDLLVAGLGSQNIVWFENPRK